MCPSLTHHCAQGDGTCRLARPGSHGPGTGLDSFDLSLGEGWVLKETTDIVAERRKKDCWVGTSPDGIPERPQSLYTLALSSVSLIRTALQLPISPLSFPFILLGFLPLLYPCSTSVEI